MSPVSFLHALQVQCSICDCAYFYVCLIVKLLTGFIPPCLCMLLFASFLLRDFCVYVLGFSFSSVCMYLLVCLTVCRFLQVSYFLPSQFLSLLFIASLLLFHKPYSLNVLEHVAALVQPKRILALIRLI